jgi:hypothetical protein
LAAATIESKSIASIVVYDSTIAGVVRCLQDTSMQSVLSARKKGPTSMDRFENGGTNQNAYLLRSAITGPIKKDQVM